jgi:hypothetical protein
VETTGQSARTLIDFIFQIPDWREKIKAGAGAKPAPLFAAHPQSKKDKHFLFSS